MKKILVVFGTRPEAIKMAPVVKELKKMQGNYTVKVCVTAQHREMLDQVLDIFKITPDYDLDLMRKGQDLFDLTSRVLLGIREVFSSYFPDLVLVHGDTTTSTAAALASFYRQIPVAHVEAGLRTKNIYSPWPEEMNRRITGQISTLHFAPTEQSKNNLIKENISSEVICVTGNTVIDALFEVLEVIQYDDEMERNIVSKIESSGYPLTSRLLQSEIPSDRLLILITGHRRENFGVGMNNICLALLELAKTFPTIDFVYPVHLNPNVQEPVYGLLSDVENIFLIPPLDYLPFVYLMEKSKIIITDSGGVQEEAPSLGKPVLVMRDTTERPEAVDAGTVLLVGTNKELIISATSDLIKDESKYESMSQAHNPYGDGHASTQIVDSIDKYFQRQVN